MQDSSALDLIVSGRRVRVTSGGRIAASGVRGGVVSLPVASCEVVDEVLAEDKHILRDVALQDIIAFLSNVGKNWKSTEYSRRRIYVSHLQRFLGYSAAMAEHVANWIALLLRSRDRMLDALTVELGSYHVMDRWTMAEEAEVKAFARGRSLHVLPGNVPLSGVVSILRALLTKNSCVIKPSSEDPFTPLALAASFLDVDPRHPVARALSVLYWPSGEVAEPIGKLIRRSDVLCVWGGTDVLDWALRNADPGAEIVRYGPRRSLALVGRDADLKDAARRLAHDISVFDQRGCFSPHRVLVERPAAEAFADELSAALTLYDRLLPMGGKPTFDELATGSLARLEAVYEGAQVMRSPDQTWSIVLGRPTMEIHPLGRLIYVQTVDDLVEASAYLDEGVQTVAVSPWSEGRRLRDAFGARGVSRIVELGLSDIFRIGSAHDGMYPLQRMVRFVSHEAGAGVHVKGTSVKVDQSLVLEDRSFMDFVP